MSNEQKAQESASWQNEDAPEIIGAGYEKLKPGTIPTPYSQRK